MEPTESERDEIALHIRVMLRVSLVIKLRVVEIIIGVDNKERFELLISVDGATEFGEC